MTNRSSSSRSERKEEPGGDTSLGVGGGARSATVGYYTAGNLFKRIFPFGWGTFCSFFCHRRVLQGDVVHDSLNRQCYENSSSSSSNQQQQQLLRPKRRPRGVPSSINFLLFLLFDPKKKKIRQVLTPRSLKQAYSPRRAIIQYNTTHSLLC